MANLAITKSYADGAALTKALLDTAFDDVQNYINARNAASSSWDFLSTSGTLAVTGAATLSSTLAVTGATTLSSTLAVTGNATFSAVGFFPSGAVATPSIAHTSDANTGIYFPANDSLSLVTSGADTLKIDSSGRVTKPLQPCFTARAAAGPLNVTGDATNYDVVFDTEDFDIGSNFNNATGVFTAPVTGKYLFTAAVDLYGFTSSHTAAFIQLITTARTYTGTNITTLVTGGLDDEWTLHITLIVNMTAADTAKIRVQASGGTKVVDIQTGSYFSGMLVA